MNFGRIKQIFKGKENSSSVTVDDAVKMIKEGMVHSQSAHHRSLALAIEAYTIALTCRNLPSEHRAVALLNRAIAYRDSGKADHFSKMLDDYDALISLGGAAPRELLAETYYNRAFAHLTSGDSKPGAAIKDFTSALAYPELRPDLRAIAHYNRGYTRGQVTGDTTGMLTDFDSVIAIKEAPSDLRAMTLRQRATAYESIDMKRAMADYEEVISSAQTPEIERVNALHDRACALMQARDVDGFIRDCSLVLQHHSVPPRLLASAAFMRGQGYFSRGNFASAIKDLRAAATTPDAASNVRAQSHFLLGMIYLKEDAYQDLKLAKSEFECVLRDQLAPDQVRQLASEVLRNVWVDNG